MIAMQELARQLQLWCYSGDPFPRGVAAAFTQFFDYCFEIQGKNNDCLCRPVVKSDCESTTQGTDWPSG